MKRQISRRALAAAAAATIGGLSGAGGTARAALPFVQGDFVVAKTTFPNTATSQAGTVTLMEYSPGGILVGQLTSPTTGTTAAATFKVSATTEGGLTITPDGRYISFAGYRANVGSTDPTDLVPAVPRVIARLDTTTGVMNTSTQFSAMNGNSIRGAVTSNGTDYWVSGASATVGANVYTDGGVRYAAGAGFGTAT